MVIHELSPAECRTFLKHATHGRLACSRDDQPYVVPFFFALDQSGESLYSISAPGRKIDWMRDNPKVCVEVDDVVDQFNWVTVLAFGRYQEIRDTDELDRLRASELFQQRATWWFPALGKRASGEESHTAVLYRILIDRLSGRRARREGA